MSILRAGVLDGVRVAWAGAGRDELADELERLGASVCQPSTDGELTGVVFDGRTTFGAGGKDGLMALLEQAWAAVHEVSSRLIASQRPAKVLLIAPPADAGPQSAAARAALENLARTLSVEWARYTITTTAILPGASTTPEELRDLACFLLSPAGDYFSGCALELGAVSLAQPN
jgi:NAD(P)-dependent dehydrogenase (short-subunit alcohol dehydrogenase family)